MSREDLDDADSVDGFVDEQYDDFLDWLVEEFDNLEMRKKFCTKRHNKFLEYKSKMEEDMFDITAEQANDDWKTRKH
jgi:hypothetical protein